MRPLKKSYFHLKGHSEGVTHLFYISLMDYVDKKKSSGTTEESLLKVCKTRVEHRDSSPSQAQGQNDGKAELRNVCFIRGHK